MSEERTYINLNNAESKIIYIKSITNGSIINPINCCIVWVAFTIILLE